MLPSGATAATQCLSEDWDIKPTRTSASATRASATAIPAARAPGSSSGDHTNGHDMDIAYYQVGQHNNWLRSV